MKRVKQTWLTTKNNEPSLATTEKLSLVGDFAGVDVWGRIHKKIEFGLFSSTRTSKKVYERVLRDNACVLELAK